MLTVTSVLGNGQRLDGGAMFGNVPRALWSGWCEPDSAGRIELACRCFLVSDGQRRILIETGVGAFFPPELRERFGVVESRHALLDSLRTQGIAPESIDVVFLSHLHFDHAGGLLSAFEQDGKPGLAFPRAQVVVSEVALERARAPHPRDRASFIPALLPLLEESGRLAVVPEGACSFPLLGARISLVQTDGHTPGMLLPVLHGVAQTAVFCADLVPGVPWVHLPITMGYDRFPESLIDEKKLLYERLGLDTLLLFTHDPKAAAGRLQRDEKGRFGVTDTSAALLGLDLDLELVETARQ